MLSKVSFSQEYVNKICERGMVIYQNKTACPDLVYVNLEARVGEAQPNSTIITIITIVLIVCIGVFLFAFKKFLQK